MQKKVLTFGTFDLLHPGHEYLLREATKLGKLVVVVARDTSVRHIKGRDPEHTEEERLAAIQALFPDAEVLLGSEEDYKAPLQAIQPDVIVMGYDQNLPPGVLETDLPCPVVRLDAFEPEKHKTSLKRL